MATKRAEAGAVKPDVSIRAVVRACRMLELLGEAPDGLGVSEVSRRLSLGKAITHNTLRTLMSCGFVEQDDQTSNYRLGTKTLKLGGLLSGRTDLRREAFAYLKGLRDSCQETVYLAELHGNEIVYVERFDSPRQLRSQAYIGERAPLHCTALGKAILSHLPWPRVEAIVKSTELQAFTDNTLVTLADLQAELALTLQRGFAIDNMEHEVGVRCVAAPVVDRKGEAYAAVSIAGPHVRMRPESDKALGARVAEVARRISERVL